MHTKRKQAKRTVIAQWELDIVRLIKITIILCFLFIASGCKASVQSDYNQAEQTNKEWQNKQMREDIEDIKDMEAWHEIEKVSNSVGEQE